MVVLSLSLQIAVALSFLAFGLLGLEVHRRARGAQPEHRAAWLLTGGAFTVHAASLLVHTVFAAAAVAAGAGSPVYARYMAWSPAMNQSRTFLLLAFTLTLIVLASWRREPDRRQIGASWVVMGAGFAAGLVVGALEPDFTRLTHYSSVATWDVVQLLVLLTALFVCLLSSRIDRHAWLALGVYGFGLALNVVWLAALSRRGQPGEWAPPPWLIPVYRLVVTLLMVAVVVRRLRLARRGTPVRGLLDGPAARVSLIG